MKRNYHEMNISSTQAEEKRKRRQILRRRIRCACWIATIVLFFLILGLVGGFDNGTMTTGEFILYAGLSVLAIWALVLTANEMERK